MSSGGEYCESMKVIVGIESWNAHDIMSLEQIEQIDKQFKQEYGYYGVVVGESDSGRVNEMNVDFIVISSTRQLIIDHFKSITGKFIEPKVFFEAYGERHPNY